MLKHNSSSSNGDISGSGYLDESGAWVLFHGGFLIITLYSGERKGCWLDVVSRFSLKLSSCLVSTTTDGTRHFVRLFPLQ